MRGAGKERRASRRVRADGASPSRDAWPGEGIAGCFGTGGAIRPEQNAPPFSWAGRGVSVSTKRAHLCGDAGRGGSPFLSLSTKAGCAGLCRQDTFPLRPGRGRGNAQGSLAAQNIRTRRACRRVRIPLGGLRPSKPLQKGFRRSAAGCSGLTAPFLMRPDDVTPRRLPLPPTRPQQWVRSFPPPRFPLRFPPARLPPRPARLSPPCAPPLRGRRGCFPSGN